MSTKKVQPVTPEAKQFIWRFAMIAGLSGILFGYDASSINDAIGFIQSDFLFNDLAKGILVAALQAGAGVGALIAGFLADRIGRKKSIIISGVLFIVGVLMATVSPDVEVLFIARLIIGFAIGVTSAVTPLYIAELAPAKKRGGMVTLYQLAITIGIFVAFLVGYLLTKEHNWRLMIFLAVIPAAIQVIMMNFSPDTPRFLMLKGRSKEARAVLEKVRGTKNVDAEMNGISEVMAIESGGSYSDIFRRAARPALVAGLGLALIQALTGINTIMYYSTFIFQVAGFTGEGTSELNSLVIGLVNMGTTVVAIRLVNRFPRRTLLLIGTAGMVASLAISGLAMLLHTNATTSGTSVAGWITLIFLITYVICFAFALGPLAWVVISEIFPLAIRGRAASLATSANWWANFVVALSFPVIVANSESRLAICFFGYAVIGIVSFFFIGFLVPETKDRTLEQIEEDLRSGGAESTWRKEVKV